ncbi:DUF881 domain-containing protein [Kitasatospora sp. NPDC085879]|uniref:DUF881 domain-containing protein n=1 Tax=Kitasatospora sp. NPDC085879 TaxID=3154769 RepID=UPI0034459705
MEQDDKSNGRPDGQPAPSSEGTGASEGRKTPGKPGGSVVPPAVPPVSGEAAAEAGRASEEPEEPSVGPVGDTPEPEPEFEVAAEPPTATQPAEQAEETGQPEQAEQAEEAEEAEQAGQADPRRRLRSAVWPPRLSRGQLVVAVLLFALGLGLAIQVRSTNDHNQLRGARQEDLVRILDELDSRQQRLQQEKTQLEQSLTQLENSSNQAKEAQEQTREKAAELGVLAGTEPATGPGIVLTINDPQGQVKADMLLDTLQELRAAGAEAIQINDVRVVAGTYFTDGPDGGVQIDGKKVSQPFRFTVVGNPQDLTPALNIPGGVVRTLEKEQATAVITQQQKVVVDALAEPKPLQYGKPAAK